jgi:hypothetical protein
MGPSSYMRPVVDRNVVMRRVTVQELKPRAFSTRVAKRHFAFRLLTTVISIGVVFIV